LAAHLLALLFFFFSSDLTLNELPFRKKIDLGGALRKCGRGIFCGLSAGTGLEDYWSELLYGMDGVGVARIYGSLRN